MEKYETEHSKFERISLTEEAFATVFDDCIHIETKRVSTGNTSANIYVPIRFKGHPATIIIWDKDKDKR